MFNRHLVAGLSILLLIMINSGATSGELIHFPDPQRTNVNMSILVIEINGLDLVDGSELAVFTPDSLIAGATTIDAAPPVGVAAWMNDDATEAKDGFDDGDTMRFVIWDPARETEFETTVEMVRGTYHTYDGDGFIVIKLQIGTLQWEEVPGDVEGEEGGSIHFDIRGTDNSGSAVTILYSSNDLPPAAQFEDHGDGSGSFDWETSMSDGGSYSAHFTLSNVDFSVGAVVNITVRETVIPPLKFALKGPFPNPVIETANFEYVIPDDSPFTLRAFDTRGRLSHSLSAGYGEGEYNTVINGESLGAGWYIFTLDVGNFRQSTTGVVLK